MPIIKCQKDLDAIIEWVSTYLPHQGTLQHFVHHNPLQAFEAYPFAEACQIVQKVYQGYSFLEPKRYLEYLQSGKIAPAVLQEQLEEHFLRNCLPKPVHPCFYNILVNPSLLSNQGIIEQSLKQFHAPTLLREVQTLIQSEQAYRASENPYYSPTYRDVILKSQGKDIDEQINPILAKFLSSYADPGCAYWRNEYKSQGLWACFKENYRSGLILENTLARQIHLELKQLPKDDLNGLILHYCEQLKLSAIPTYLLAMGLRLRGWAGFFNQLQHHPEEALDQTSFDLKEFLLVKLVLEYVVVTSYLGTLTADILPHFFLQQKKAEKKQFETELLYLVIHTLEQNQWAPGGKWNWQYEQKVDFILTLRHLMRFQRQLIYQNALEQTYANRCLHALATANSEEAAQAEPANEKPVFAYITCLDDREESLRRYLEQVEPGCRTFGVAGHFELNMHFKGLNEVRYRKLCPGSIAQTFRVQQVVDTEIKASQVPAQSKRVSRLYAQIFRSYGLHSKISFFSYFITLASGYLSAVPFFLKVFFPHLDLMIRQKAKSLFLQQKKWVDLIFQEQGNPEGLTYQQGAEKVYQLLKTIDLSAPFSELIYIVGHGSSSINNPHEYAYNCGACGGGEGRANARIFATIANHPEVRKILRAQYQLDLPDETVFVGGFHDTCKDQVSWSDVDLTPAQKALHQNHQCVIQAALTLNAAERARKFYNVPGHLSLPQIHAKVQTRSNDLTEARPEYNHATNALCLIGRRTLSQRVFLDRRAFLCSYNPNHDDGSVLAKIMGAAIPVCAGINLEYYFSTVDTEIYGCGSKLNHNITNNYAVMSGFASDLRLGLSKQMVEIHDPMRILIVIESKPEIVLEILKNNRQLRQLVENQWVRLVVYDFEKRIFFAHQGQQFIPTQSAAESLKTYPVSQAIEVNAKNLIPVAILEVSHD